MCGEFYSVLIESRAPGDAFYQPYWVGARHRGEAIERAIEAARLQDVSDPVAHAIDPCDFDDIPDDAHPIAEKLYADSTRFQFPNEYSFHPPTGVVASQTDGELDYGLIRPGFASFESDEGIHNLEIVVEEPDLLPTYEALLSLVPQLRVVWARVAPDWDDGDEAFYANEAIGTPSALLAFLESHALDTVQNGFVTITAYAERGAANLNIDEHKTIKVLSTDESLHAEMASVLSGLGLDELELESFYSIERGYYHYHFRPSASMNRESFVKFLASQGFSPWHPG